MEAGVECCQAVFAAGSLGVPARATGCDGVEAAGGGRKRCSAPGTRRRSSAISCTVAGGRRVGGSGSRGEVGLKSAAEVGGVWAHGGREGGPGHAGERGWGCEERALGGSEAGRFAARELRGGGGGREAT